ncbi:MAG: amino acid adenylation domain-containing protein [Pseudomonadota bacterium]
MRRTTLFDAVDDWAGRAPVAEAFRCAGRSLTYRDLAERSNQLAHWLINAGVRPGDRVGIFLHKSLETAIAVFGILKAGAAFAPLDPGAPVQRLRAIVDDCTLKALITHGVCAETALEICREPTSVVAVLGTGDFEWDAFAGLPNTPPTRRPDSSDRAYIIFTSGSTGAPKGIEHTHTSGLAYAEMATSLYSLGSQDRLANHSPLHFDMSTFDYFSAPIAGACTVIIPEPYAKLPASLSKLTQDEGITIWYSTPFALVQLVEHGALDARDISRLRWVIFGGEPMSPKHLEALRCHAPEVQFSNSYGPAEVNQTTVYHLPSGRVEAGPIPLGKVTPHAEARIVDGEGRPATEGELMISTPAMMAGYWNREDLTEAAIEIDKSGDRWYRTGDIVRWGPDGLMQFVGRKDRQVKVRGHRVELDEVEHALKAHPAVAECGAVVIGEPARILAAVSLRPGHVIGQDALKSSAKESLPAYAVPERVEIVSEFPRTTSGKIDRRVLREQLEKEPTHEG